MESNDGGHGETAQNPRDRFCSFARRVLGAWLLGATARSFSWPERLYAAMDALGISFLRPGGRNYCAIRLALA
jgi:hypothetical protein